MTNIPEDTLREKLAAYAHEAWRGWMYYMLSKVDRVKTLSNGDILISVPAWAAERWKRQMSTEFSMLPEEEKESDRAEADQMLAIVFKGERPPVGDGENGAIQRAKRST